MIVYKACEKRTNNFNQIQKIIPDILMFEAIDSVNLYEYYLKEAERVLTSKYINKTLDIKGKLGCNLSHIYLLEEFLSLDNNWMLVLEDDIEVKHYSEEHINKIVDIATSNSSNFVQLYTNPEFLIKQKNSKEIKENIYEMIPQWHTCAYLISQEGAKLALAHLPFDNHIDLFFNEVIPKLKSLCYINNIFFNEGAKTSIDYKNSKFGSIIIDSIVK